MSNLKLTYHRKLLGTWPSDRADALRAHLARFYDGGDGWKVRADRIDLRSDLLRTLIVLRAGLLQATLEGGDSDESRRWIDALLAAGSPTFCLSIGEPTWGAGQQKLSVHDDGRITYYRNRHGHELDVTAELSGRASAELWNVVTASPFTCLHYKPFVPCSLVVLPPKRFIATYVDDQKLRAQAEFAPLLAMIDRWIPQLEQQPTPKEIE